APSRLGGAGGGGRGGGGGGGGGGGRGGGGGGGGGGGECEWGAHAEAALDEEAAAGGGVLLGAGGGAYPAACDAYRGRGRTGFRALCAVTFIHGPSVPTWSATLLPMSGPAKHEVSRGGRLATQSGSGGRQVDAAGGGWR